MNASSLITRLQRRPVGVLAWSTALLLVVTIALLSGCQMEAAYQLDEAPPVEMKVRFEIGADLDPPEGPAALLMIPAGVVLDDHGNLFVLDDATLTVKVFNSSGRFLQEFGGKGVGPGEFSAFGAWWATPGGGSVSILDHRQGFVSQYSVEGLVGREPWPIRHQGRVRPLGGDSLLLLSYKFPVPAGEESHLGELFVGGLTGESVHLIKADEFVSDPVVETLYAILPGSAIKFRAGVLYAPTLYDGRLYHYRNTTAKSQWRLESTIKGVETPTPIEEVDPGDLAVSAHLRSSFAGRDFAARINSSSLGLFGLQGGGFAHFFEVEKDGRRRLVVERYSRNGEFERAGWLLEREVNGGEAIGLNWLVASRNAAADFYFIDRSEVPRVLVAAIPWLTE